MAELDAAGGEGKRASAAATILVEIYRNICGDPGECKLTRYIMGVLEG